MKNYSPRNIGNRPTRSKILWKYFPVLYVLPFILASLRIEAIAQTGNILRWVILCLGVLIAVKFGLKRSKPKGTADYFIIAFLGFFLLSSYWSIVPTYTAQRVVSLFLIYICSFILFWRYTDQFSEDTLIRYLLYTTGCLLAINLLGGAVLFSNELLTRRFQGLFENPNNIGILISVTLPLATARWLHTKNRYDFIVTAILTMNLIASGSRSAMLAVGIAMIPILVSLLVKKPRWAFFIAIITLLNIGFFIQTTYFDKHVLRSDTLETASNRTIFWKMAEDYIDKRPNLGHGFASDRGIHAYYGLNLRHLGLRGYGVMSSYYGLAIQIGWPITFLFFGLIWGFVLLCIIKYWKNYTLVALSATLMSGLIVSIFETTLYSAGNMFSFLFWLWFMLAVRRLRLKEHQKRKNRLKFLFSRQSQSRTYRNFPSERLSRD